MKVFQTVKNTSLRIGEVDNSSKRITDNFIEINKDQLFQEHMGFGGAFTEAAAFTLSEASKELRLEAIKAYFSPEGLAYTLGRVHIHSCDFALGNYTYVEEGDKELKTFDLSHEDKWVIPMIEDAKKYMNDELLILASPWSPPAFMKNTNEMNNGGYLLEEYYQPWANYFVKFVEGMKDKGVDIWGVSIQNEPAAVQTWDSCIYTAEEERDFVKNYLGPTMHKANLEDKAILIWDHNRDILLERVTPTYVDAEASKYVWGVGNHWYCSEDFSQLSKVHDLAPDKHILFTEGCVEYGIYGSVPRWENGEHYGRNIIGDFNNYSRGWIDWNLVLNEQGGPNHVSNFCEAPIMYDRVKKELIYNISYFYIGHFSKFIKRGAHRLGLNMKLPEGVVATAFKNNDGSVALVVQNETNELVDTTLNLSEGSTYSLPAHSISTFVIGE